MIPVPESKYPVTRTMKQTVEQIRERFDKNDRMNCRDILDLIEAIDAQAKEIERLKTIAAIDITPPGTMAVCVIEMREELDQLRKDKARLDWLERIGFATVQRGPGMREPGVHCWRNAACMPWRWTSHWVSSECANARAAIDAAMEIENV